MSVWFYPVPVEHPDFDIDDMDEFSSFNAAMLLDQLGFVDDDPRAGVLDRDLTGRADASDFLGRVLLAKALVPADEGVPALADVVVGQRLTHMGRRPGYTQDALDRLESVARRAIAAGTAVTWG